ncbi:phosphoribosylformylglycinamidine synthase [Clostridia bacterium]|nr:phosphoribosylformylglycinamidine synthase [Clostridia bacterium]
MNKVKRIYVEKKPPYAVAAKALYSEIKSYLGIHSITSLRVLIRYDVEGVSEDSYQKALTTVFSEPPVDTVYEGNPDFGSDFVFGVEYLPGQFDQRADSAAQCIKLLHETEDVTIRTAVLYVIEGSLSEEQRSAIKEHCINPVDSCESSLHLPETLLVESEEPEDVAVLTGFLNLSEEGLREQYASLGLAMTFADYLHIRKHFEKEERRDPTITEIRVLDTYWSDHCRHTTFLTELKEVRFGEGYYKAPIEASYRNYQAARADLYGGRSDKFPCLMDLALAAMKLLKKEGKLEDQEESDEINACSIVVPVTVDGQEQEWLLNFKNETHNHPTEIEPFGGAATCLGGAIRDPLSGRTYVYQAMRVTGAADPTLPVKNTMKGKLPQKRIVRGAAHGYSSYGNQIGLATGYVKEIYHPDYVAKRMEIGAVLGAAPRRAVRRLTSDPGDVVILLGGRTGRDGIGGATGSSKVHTAKSIRSSGAEVQKGNPPTERKIQRLFRREEVSFLIKKCNDFGAGGVSVAIGELADGLRIFLDKVPKKYAGLDGTELSISESQERMAVVVAPDDVAQFLAYAKEENLEAVKAAVVTKEPRLILEWRGKEIVNLSRSFLDTNGAHQETAAEVEIPDKENNFFEQKSVQGVEEALAIGDLKKAWLLTLSDLNVCSQKGLVEMFDASIGAGSVFMPYGGKYQLTETQAMAAKFPVLSGKCDAVSLMSCGFDPYLSAWSPYHGAIYAVTESVARIVAAGGDYEKIRFTFQEYFRRMTGDPKRWSQPLAALLGAYNAQMGFGLPSIGGKDSMSGSFHDIDVPPTLVSFAVDVAKEGELITPEFKAAGNKIVNLKIVTDEYGLPVYEQVKALYGAIHKLILGGGIISAYALDGKGMAAALSKMAFGNKLGVTIDEKSCKQCMFSPRIGNLVAEVPAEQVEFVMKSINEATIIGEVNDLGKFIYGEVEITIEEALAAWTGTLEKVFPTKSEEAVQAADTRSGEGSLQDPERKGKSIHNTVSGESSLQGFSAQSETDLPLYHADSIYISKTKTPRPTVFLPVFPGTNCEYDSVKAFEAAGARTVVRVFQNQTEEQIRDSVSAFAKAIAQAQILMFPGGFSAGDEPEGSAKFFAAAFRNQKIAEEVNQLLSKRDGLVLGICNGFQALIKLGLLPYGEIRPQTSDSPTLTYNTIGRHISKMVYTKVVSNKSPWLSQAKLGASYCSPASHGEGRFVAPKAVLDTLIAQGQVATQYADSQGQVSMDEEWNVNGSYLAIEGITSPDGRVFGKMAHAERKGSSVAINIHGEQDIKLFESGVEYFR